jgi:hypothetical protein
MDFRVLGSLLVIILARKPETTFRDDAAKLPQTSVSARCCELKSGEYRAKERLSSQKSKDFPLQPQDLGPANPLSVIASVSEAIQLTEKMISQR